MRTVLTSFLAFILSGFAGGLVAQILAVETGATEEYILVFVASAIITCLVTAVFFVSQFFHNPARAVNATAIVLLVLLAVVLVALAGWTLSLPAAQRATAGDLSIIAGLVLPGLATILVHWLIVRWRVAHAPGPAGFGRGGAPA